jgi:hypothetical protein
MQISRHGERANHGVKSVTLDKIRVKWSAPSKEFQVTSPKSAYDFSTYAKHMYNVKLSLEETALLLKELGDNAASVPIDELEAAITPILPSLIRLMNTACRA